MSDLKMKAISEREKSFPAVFESLDHIRDFVGAAAEDGGFSPEAIYAVQLAVDEAFSNIVEHAYGGECDLEIRCVCQISEDRLAIRLEDCGLPFNPADVPEPNLDACLEEREVGGLGLFFIRKLMDEINFEFIPASGKDIGLNILTLIKRKEKPD